MATVRNYFWAFTAVLIGILMTGVCGGSASSNSESGGGMNGIEIGVIVGGIACAVVIVMVIALCVEKRIHVETFTKGPPYWTRNLVHKPEYNGGLSAVSDGMNNLSPFHVIRDRLGMAVTDGARWDVGFTEGKHVFEVVWPVKKNRGTNSSIGVGTMEVPLKKQGRVTLVGQHSQSWGLDLSSRKMTHANKKTGNFQKQIPDRFYLYVDMDSGKIGFGEDIKLFGRDALFYGDIVNAIRLDRNVPMYLMIGMCAPKEEVQIYYIGTAVKQGGFDLVPTDPGPSQPPPYEQKQAMAQEKNDKDYEVKVHMPDPVPAAPTY